MKNSNTTDISIQFAVLWGQTIGAALALKEHEIAEQMKQYDSEELSALFAEWKSEFLNCKAEDTVVFFEGKLAELFKEVPLER